MNKEILNNIKVSDIKPYERNARKNDHSVKEVAKSIKRTGYRTPIIVDENNVVLAGHTRLKAIQSLVWTEIPFVVQYTDLTEEQKQEYRIRDNKTGELAEWDFEILEADFSSDELIEFGFKESGYNDPYEEYKELEYNNTDKTGFKSLTIHFETEFYYNDFIKMITPYLI